MKKISLKNVLEILKYLGIYYLSAKMICFAIPKILFIEDVPEKSEENETPEEPDKEVEKEGAYTCTVCNKSYKKEGNLKRHVETSHKEENSDDRTCTDCNKVFTKRCHFLRHIRDVHSKISKVTCNECNKEFTNKDNLDWHVKQIHKKSGVVECEICNKTVSSVGNLKRHMEAVHETKKEECKICGKLYNRSNLKQHIDIVHNKKELCECTVCGLQLKTKKGLEFHMLKTHRA